MVFGLLVFIHELGHFLLAKKVGIRVDEFALGFGPVLGSVKRGETLYAVRLFPLGGYVRMAGSTPQDQDDARGFAKRTVGQRMQVILAGPVMNFLLAVVIFAAAFATYGIVKVDGTAVGQVLSGKPAERAGLRVGDRVVAVDRVQVKGWDDLVARIQASPGRQVVFTVNRGGSTLDLTVTPEVNPDTPGKGFIGIGPSVVRQRLTPFGAVATAVGETGRMIILWVRGLTTAIFRGQTADVAGPVGITQMIGEATRAGLMNLLFLAAALSANLGLLNLLPIPALDGSRFLFLMVEKVRGKPVDPEKENFIHFIGFAFLLLLLVAITYRDIARLTSPGS